MFDFEAENPFELSFHEGDVIRLIEQVSSFSPLMFCLFIYPDQILWSSSMRSGNADHVWSRPCDRLRPFADRGQWMSCVLPVVNSPSR